MKNPKPSLNLKLKMDYLTQLTEPVMLTAWKISLEQNR